MDVITCDKEIDVLCKEIELKTRPYKALGEWVSDRLDSLIAGDLEGLAEFMKVDIPTVFSWIDGYSAPKTRFEQSKLTYYLFTDYDAAKHLFKPNAVI